MTRIPQEEIERLKAEIPIQRLAEARGVVLRQHGMNLIGLCPFHDDKNPSLVITPDKNLWHCLGACQCGGSVIDWVMKAESVDFLRAVELLRTGYASAAATAAPAVPAAFAAPAARPRIQPTQAHDEMLGKVADFYAAALTRSDEARAYLNRRGIGHAETIRHFGIGVALRELGVWVSQQENSEEMRRILTECGVFREQTGHEHLRGCIVFPIKNQAGAVVGMYGRTVNKGQGSTDNRHRYLGPHRGVPNVEAIKLAGKTHGELILAESFIGMAALWQAGFRNVTCAYGVNGFTPEHLEIIRDSGIQKVLIAYDRDEAGDGAARRLAKQLVAAGIGAFRVQFPAGMDADSFALTITPPGKSFGVVLRSALWLGDGPAPMLVIPQQDPVFFPSNEQATLPPAAARPPKTPPVIPTETPGNPADSADSDDDTVSTCAPVQAHTHEGAAAPAPVPVQAPAPALPRTPAPTQAQTPAPVHAGADAPVPACVPAPTLAPAALAGAGVQAQAPAPVQAPAPTPAPVQAGADAPAPKPAPTIPSDTELQKDGLVLFSQENRRYEVAGALSGKADFVSWTIRVRLFAPDGIRFDDRVDLYAGRSRRMFTEAAHAATGLSLETLTKDLGTLLIRLEMLRDLRGKDKADPVAAMPPEDRAAAEGLNASPDLMAQTVAALTRIGLIGEGTNKLLALVGVISRKLSHPLAIIIQSLSGAGKSALMDAVLELVPEEEKVLYTAMSDKSLFYLGEGCEVKHKVLSIAEDQGVSGAAYAMKTLQSQGKLTMASTGKDPQSGKMTTFQYQVEGPVMMMWTTTAAEIEEELQSRCVVLSIDETASQTRAVHVRQRKSRTLEGRWADVERERLIRLHQNGQRLLKSVVVVNNFADYLHFPDHLSRLRREHAKFLTMIDSIALWHQGQRKLHCKKQDGQTLEYIEATLSDVAVATKLAHHALGRSLDELSAPTRSLLEALHSLVEEHAKRLGKPASDIRLTRREIRQASGFSVTGAHIHLSRLVELEYMLQHQGGRGQTHVYEVLPLAGKSSKPQLPGLLTVEELARRYAADHPDWDMAGNLAECRQVMKSLEIHLDSDLQAAS